MKPEGLKQLKPGDDIFIRAKYVRILNCGEVYFSHFRSEGSACGHTLASNVILPTDLQPAPKYDPCRLFKKGDSVRPVVRYGRYPDDGALANVTYVVVDDEKNGRVSIARHDGKSGYAHTVTALYLELVTPVEELEPYFIKEDKIELWWEVWKRDEEVGGLLVALFSTGEHPNSKAAAEAECARLNAEHRKEQK